jgi:hypothetical protein
MLIIVFFFLGIVFVGFAAAAFDKGKGHLLVAEPSGIPTSGTTYFAGGGIDIHNGVIQLEETIGSTLLGNFTAHEAIPHVSQDIGQGGIIFGGGRSIVVAPNTLHSRLRVESGLPQWVVRPDLYDNGPILLPPVSFYGASGILSGLDTSFLRVIQLADVPAVNQSTTTWFCKVWFECTTTLTGSEGALVLPLALPAAFVQGTTTTPQVCATGSTDTYLLSMQGTELIDGELHLTFVRPDHSSTITDGTLIRVSVGIAVLLVRGIM